MRACAEGLLWLWKLGTSILRHTGERILLLLELGNSVFWDGWEIGLLLYAWLLAISAKASSSKVLLDWLLHVGLAKRVLTSKGATILYLRLLPILRQYIVLLREDSSLLKLLLLLVLRANPKVRHLLLLLLWCRCHWLLICFDGRKKIYQVWSRA